MEMDFRSLKRRDLQKLCKKHGLRANLTNLQMADSLASLFQMLEKNKRIKGCLKGSCGSSGSEGEIVQGISKKVTFVINEEKESDAVLCSRDGYCSPRRRSSRRLSKVFEPKKVHGETQDVVIVKNPTEGCAVPVRTTRSRSRISGVMCCPVREKKKARRSGEVTRKNVQVLSGKGEHSTIGTRKEVLSEMNPIRTLRNGVVLAGEANAKRKRNRWDSSVDFNNENIVSLPVEVDKIIDLFSEEENSCARIFTPKSPGEVSKIVDLVDEEEILCKKSLATKSLREVSDAIDLVSEEQNLCAVSSNVEVVWETPSGERTVETSNNAQISLTIDRHDGHKLCYLVECDSEVVGRENSNVVVIKKDKDFNTLARGGDGALEESTSIQVEDFNEAPETTSNAVMTWEDVGPLCHKFEEKATDSGQDVVEAITATASPDICTISSDGHKGMTECVEAEQVSKISLSFGKEIIKPQNLIVSSIIEDSATVVGNHFGFLEFDKKDASSTNEICHRNSYALSLDLKKLSECKAHLDTDELEDDKFLKEKQDLAELVVPKDSNVEENRSLLSPQSYESREKENGINLIGYDEKVTEKYETIQKSPDSIEFGKKNASSTNEIYGNSYALSLNLKKLSECKAHLDTDELEDDKFLKEKQDLTELVVPEDSNVEEYQSFLSPQYYGSSEKKNGINLIGYDENVTEKSETMQKCPDSNEFDKMDEIYSNSYALVLDLKKLSRCKAHLDTGELEDDTFLKEKQDLTELVVPEDSNVEENQSFLSPQYYGSREEKNGINLKGYDEKVTEKSETIQKSPDNIEFDKKDASSTDEIYGNSYALILDLNKLSGCKAHLDTDELEDDKFLKEIQDLAELVVPEDSNVEENSSFLSPQSYESREKKNGINLKGYDEKVAEKSETIQKSPDSIRPEEAEHTDLFTTTESGILLAENGSYLGLKPYQSSDKKNGINFSACGENIREKSEAIQKFPSCIRLKAEPGEFFENNESVILLQELSQIKGGESFAFNGNHQVNQDNFKHVGEKLCSAVELQAVGSVKALEIENYAGNLPEEMEEIAPFELGKRFDNIMERMICLKKVLRGEIAPFGIALSEKEMSCQESHSTGNSELSLGEPYTAYCKEEMEVLTTMMPADSVHDELNGFEANIKGKIDEIAITSSVDLLQGNADFWKSRKSCEANNTDIATPFECYFSYIKPEGEPCPGGYADSKEYLKVDQGTSAKPIEVLETITFVSPSIELEGERNCDSSYFLEKNKLSNSIKNSPVEDDKKARIPYLSETLDVHSSLSVKHANAKHPVGLLAMESHDDSLFRTVSIVGDVPHERNAPFGSCYADIFEQCDSSYVKPDEGEPCQGRDLDVKSNEVLQKIKFVSPIQESSTDLEFERSFSVSSISEKSTMCNGMIISAKEDKYVGIPCLSETPDGHNSLSVVQANSKHLISLLATDSQDCSLQGTDSLAYAIPLERNEPSNSYTAGPIEECDLSYVKSAGRGYLEIDQYASEKTIEVLQKIELPPSKKNSIDLEAERSSGASCISENSRFCNSPAKDIKHCLSETLHGHSSLLVSEANAEYLDPLTMESDLATLYDVVPSECKVPFRDSIADPIEEITHKLINFTISSGQKAFKTDILSTPTKSAGNFKVYTSVSSRIRGKENTTSTKKNYSNYKMRSAISAGSIRRPLQSVTNQMPN